MFNLTKYIIRIFQTRIRINSKCEGVILSRMHFTYLGYYIESLEMGKTISYDGSELRSVDYYIKEIILIKFVVLLDIKVINYIIAIPLHFIIRFIN